MACIAKLVANDTEDSLQSCFAQGYAGHCFRSPLCYERSSGRTWMMLEEMFAYKSKTRTVFQVFFKRGC